VALFTYDGPPGGHYSFLRTRHGTAPFTGLEPGDIVDFGEHQPPEDGRWRTAKTSASATRRPDNAPSSLSPLFSDAPPAADVPRRGRPARNTGS
jgi:hypothetical protein